MNTASNYKGMTIKSNDGAEVGTATGSTHRCTMAGCTGLRIATRWADGKVTYPCSKGLIFQSNGSAILG